mgnify:CR=1 FL=1
MTIEIDRDLLWELSREGATEEYPFEGWIVVRDEVVDTWRWGVNKELILRQVDSDPAAGPFYGITYRVETSNENYISSLKEENNPVVLREWEAFHQVAYRPKGKS